MPITVVNQIELEPDWFDDSADHIRFSVRLAYDFTTGDDAFDKIEDDNEAREFLTSLLQISDRTSYCPYRVYRVPSDGDVSWAQLRIVRAPGGKIWLRPGYPGEIITDRTQQGSDLYQAWLAGRSPQPWRKLKNFGKSLPVGDEEMTSPNNPHVVYLQQTAATAPAHAPHEAGIVALINFPKQAFFSGPYDSPIILENTIALLVALFERHNKYDSNDEKLNRGIVHLARCWLQSLVQSQRPLWPCSLGALPGCDEFGVLRRLELSSEELEELPCRTLQSAVLEATVILPFVRMGDSDQNGPADIYEAGADFGSKESRGISVETHGHEFPPLVFETDLVTASGFSRHYYAARTHTPRSLVEDKTSLLDVATGYFRRPNGDVEVLARRKRMLEGQAASQLGAMQAVLSLETLDLPCAAPVVIDALLRRLAWQFGSAINASLDTIYLALFGAGLSKRAGPILQELVVKLQAALPQVPDDERLGPAQLLAAVRAVLRGPLDGTAADDFAKLGEFAQLVADLAGWEETFLLSAAPKEGASVLAKLVQLAQFPNSFSVLKLDFARLHLGLSSPAEFDAIHPDALGAVRDAALVRLGELSDRLQSENGVEQIIWSLLLKAGGTANSASENEKIGATAGAIGKQLWGAAPTSAQIENVSRAIAAFKTTLDQAFNGAEAVRQAASAVFSVELMTVPNTVFNATSPEDELSDRVKGSSFLRRRLLGDETREAVSSLARVLGVLRKGSATLLSAPNEKQVLSDALVAALASISDRLRADGNGRRFVADSAPVPLPLTIAVDQDINDLDDFANRYNGIGVVVRRSHWHEEKEVEARWAHAGLGELKLQGGKLVLDWPSILPQRTAEVDGTRVLQVDYEGQPFAYMGFEQVARPIDPIGDKLVAFASADSPDPGTWDNAPWSDFARLPSLAYGATYSVVGHVVTKGGVLPYDLRADKSKPWLPAGRAFEFNSPAEEVVQEFSYFRRTAIGRTSMIEPERGRERIGSSIADVHPLSRDYPRVGMAVLPKEPVTFFDLFRAVDGEGLLQLPTELNGHAHIELTDIAWWGEGGDMFIFMMDDADAPLTPVSGAMIFNQKVHRSFANARISFSIDLLENEDTGSWYYRIAPEIDGIPDAQSGEIRADFDQLGRDKRVWLRTFASSEGHCAISLADPARDANGGPSSRADGDPLLVIAEADSGVWQPGVGAPVKATITTPRVGFVDFCRWMNNPALCEEAGLSPDLRQQLIAIYTARHRDERLSKLLERLPDPAVSKLRLTLSPLDGLAAEPKALAAAHRPSSVDIDMPSLGEVSTAAQPFIARLPALTGDKLADGYTDLLTSTLKTFELPLEVRSEGVDFTVRQTATGIEVLIPPGMSGQLTIRAMVEDRLVDDPGLAARAPLHKDLAQLAVGHADGYHLFDGTAIKIEAALGQMTYDRPDAHKPWQTLPSAWQELAAIVVQTRPVGDARKYDLVARAKDIIDASEGWRWRQVGSAELRTQRWNFSGRPIYNWIDPSLSARTKGSGGSVRRIQFATQRAQLRDFETEAFFDRDDEDAERRTMVVTPLPNDAVLQTFEWEKPSATMFRHRLTLRSRYAGAMQPRARRAINCWVGKEDELNHGGLDKPESWIRAVVLGDRNHIELSRPPVRALIPLTQPVDALTGSYGRTPPPVLAILEERPFNYGGLADRVCFEISTGVGYGFPEKAEGSAPADRVAPQDLRKEIGLDARLDYRPLEEGYARGMTVMPEGPIGLTFDRATAPKPAFINTAVVLHPFNMLRADGTLPVSLEEHFLALGARRYLDNRWLNSAATDTAKNAPFPATSGWWIELPEAGLELEHLYNDGIAVHSKKILKVTLDSRKWSVSVYREAIDPTVDAGEKPLPLCGALRVHAARLALLHLPLEPGRFSLSVFAVADGSADVRRGLADLPQMIASIDWSPGLGVPTQSLRLDCQAVRAEVSASPMTSRAWTRTGRDFTAVGARTSAQETTVFAADQIGASLAVDQGTNAASLVFSERGLSEPLWLIPTRTAESEAPRNIHRQLTALFTRSLEGSGRTVEQYAGAATILGNRLDLPTGMPTSGLKVRIVETETPAAIIYCGQVDKGAVYQLKQLATAYFDRVAIGKGGAFSDSSFFVRFAGTAPQRSKIADVDLAIALPADEKHAAGQHDLTNLSPFRSGPIDCSPISGVPIRGLLFSLRENETKDGKAFGWHYRTLHDDGTLSDERDLTVPKGMTADWFAGSAGLLLAVQAQGVGGELWADVSMLSGSHLDFNFNWLFSSEHTEPSIALRPDAMAAVPEAEARIIAVSPPIPVSLQADVASLAEEEVEPQRESETA
jgi:hypothetical protein